MMIEILTTRGLSACSYNQLRAHISWFVRDISYCMRLVSGHGGAPLGVGNSLMLKTDKLPILRSLTVHQMSYSQKIRFRTE